MLHGRSRRRSFYTAWVNYGLSRHAAARSALRGEADLIRRKADIAAGRVRRSGIFFFPQPWQAVLMRALTIALCLLSSPSLSDVAGVASVIDGDTMEIHGQRIRLHGIDAPESRQLCRLDGKSWQCGEVAANALADKIARRSVTCEDLGRDRYKRIIAKLAHSGISSKVIMELAGHKHLSTTQRYIEVDDRMKQAAVEVV